MSYPAPVYVKLYIRKRLFDALQDQPYSVYAAALGAVSAGYEDAMKDWEEVTK